MTNLNDESASKGDSKIVPNFKDITSPPHIPGNERTILVKRANDEADIPQHDDNQSGEGRPPTVTDDGWTTTLSTSSGDCKELSPKISEVGPEISTNILNNPHNQGKRHKSQDVTEKGLRDFVGKQQQQARSNSQPTSYRLRRFTREKRNLISTRQENSDGAIASCSESQSSASSSVSTHRRRSQQHQSYSPPGGMLVEGVTVATAGPGADSAGRESNQTHYGKSYQNSQQQQQPSSSISETATMALLSASSPVGIPPSSVIRTNSGVSAGASSEEDSVAEMDYMSENSNISVAGNCTTEDMNASLPLHRLPSVNQFIPMRGTEATTTSETVPNSTIPFGFEQPKSSVESCSPTSRRTRLKNKDKNSLKSKLSTDITSNSNLNHSSDSFRPISIERKSSLKSPGFVTKSSGVRYTTATSSVNIPSVKLPSSVDSEGSTTESFKEDIKTPSTKTSNPTAVEGDDRAIYLPKFRHPKTCMWTASHAANSPSEDRSASLVNLLLQPLPPNFDSETQLLPLEPDYKTLIRLNLWAVIDGHGGGCVATYGSEVLLPHIAASVSRALGCAIVDRGVCTVNGQLRDANALDLDGLIQTHQDRAFGNPNSIHYRSPYERSDSDVDEECEGTNSDDEVGTTIPQTVRERKRIKSIIKNAVEPAMTETNHHPSDPAATDASVSSVKTSVKTAASAPVGDEALVGTHSPREVAAITRAITESFLAVDEAWINSIDPVATHQTSCQSNGRWNSGACALVVFTVQRLVWTNVSEPDREKESMEPEKSRRNTTQNRDAARRRMLDYASRTKSASSMSTVSSTSSLTTEEAVNASGIESEITETEGEDDDRSFNNDVRKRDPMNLTRTTAGLEKVSSLINPPGGSSGHCYRAHTSMIYTAHVGDCRAVMLGSAPPRTIKVGDFSSLHQDTTDDESSHHSSDETECLSSSDHDADSSEEEELENADGSTKSTTTASSFMNFPRRVVRQKNAHRRANDDVSGPFIALPPLAQDESTTSIEFDFETDLSRRRGEGARRTLRVELSDASSTSSQDSIDLVPLIHLPPVTRPIDLTTDHSAYNPAEVTAVLRRCNNAPRAISAGVGGGIKRVAGSLAVTRALGDAYLKTPLLSFLPYKSHAPYITARPEVNCRPLLKDGDKVLILATDGVWERASGEDVLRWVRNFYEERLAEAVRRSNRRSNTQLDKSQTSSDEDVNDSLRINAAKNFFQQQEGSERDLFDYRIDPSENSGGANSRKRDNASSPVQNNGGPAKRRRRGRYTNANNVRVSYNVADVIVRRVLNKVRRARNISSLQALMSLPPGRARRSKHDDITASVVDLSAFVS